MTIGKNIKTARENAQLTQRELAQKINKGFSTIQKYELDLVSPPIDVVQKIADNLGVSVGYLLGYETEHQIIPGRLKIVEVNAPESADIAYKIEAADQEAYEFGLKMFNDAGAGITPKKRIDAAFNALNEKGQLVAALRVEELTKISDYQKK